MEHSARLETPEEYVRQEIEKSLVREYQYPREEIKVEFPIRMGRSNKRADLVIFPEDVQPIQADAWAIIECKSEETLPTDRTEGVEQLQSYMTACVNAELGM